MNYSKCFLHVDMDAFFASVEQLDHPEWRGKPVIVGGLPGEPRSVVSTASYEARKYGVHSAMPVAQAVKLCPNGIYTHGSYKRYSEVSCNIMDILKKYSPDVNQLSIDEASVDITGTEMLFGPPDQLALKIQKEIFDFTGLTVSVGLASTAYLAKLCSEVNKPNGFFAIPQGEEESFMLKLPLKNVWGIGDKTLMRLNKCGFFTTKDIHAKSLNTLKMMLGENSGTFLYNTVRGIESEGPSKPSTHSISNETTFPVDLTDIYTAETAIMELCYSVMFRLLKQKSFSKTIVIKIRYEDFTTVSTRQTYDEYVSSTDDLFEKAKALFEKKYEFGRGIRLLGVGLDNVQDENAPVQEVLFDFGAKKKQAVESAILKMSAKHPEIKVKKARMLNTDLSGKVPAFILTFLLAFIPTKKAMAEEYINQVEEKSAAAINPALFMLPIPKEAPRTLFDYTINNKEIEFLAQGWWQGDFTGSVNSTYTKENGLSAANPNFVFQQKVDLSLWFMLNKQWYFETSFADEFTKNTIAAGFYGKDSNPLREVRIANRGITFPDTYSISLFNRGIGGGDNQAPGFMAHFESPTEKRWKADLALRYDMVQQQDATFYGKNSVSLNTIKLNSFVTGQFFTLPEQLVSRLKAVYVESNSGSHKDSVGRKYKKLNQDDYLVISSKNLIVISKDAGSSLKNKKLPAVIFEFEGLTDFSTVLGEYTSPETFLGEVQAAFPGDINLEKFAYDYRQKIDGNSALLVQNDKGFSPFIFANYYDAGISSSNQIILGSTTTQETVPSYSAEITQEFENFLNSSFINDKHIYAQVFKTEDSSPDIFAPKNRYPLAALLPGIYLNYSENTDLALLVRTFTPVASYSIGTNASGGSVNVYKNGILDPGAKYNKDSGTVELSSNVSDLDKIYITWNEDSTDSQNGSLAAQAGFSAALTKNTSTDLSLAFNWTVSPYANYGEAHRNPQGYATLAAGIRHENKGILVSNSSSASYENKNTTGLYRIDGFENAEAQTYYLGKNSLYLLPEDFVPVLNLQNSTSPTLAPENQFTTVSKNQKGISDTNISGYKIPLEWDVSSSTQDNPWAAINISLNAGSLLANASSIDLALQFEKELLDDYQLYLQLGVEASGENDKENPSLTPTFLIEDFTKDLLLSEKLKSENWHTATIRLQDYEKSLISQYHDARLIVVRKTDAAGSVLKGTIYIGPYEINSKGILCSAPDYMNLTTEQVKDNSIPSRKTFNKDDNVVQKISWDSSKNLDSDEEIHLARYFEEQDIFAYKKLNFFIKSAALENLEIVLDRNGPNLNEDGKFCLKVSIHDTALSGLTENNWHKLSLNLKDKTVQLDDFALSKESYTFYSNKKVIPSRFKLNLKPVSKKGTVQLDELYLEETTSNFLLEDIARLKLEKKGSFLKVGNLAIAQDAKFETQQNASAIITEDNSSQNGILSSSTSAEVTFLGVKIEANADLSSDEEKILSSAGQRLETTKPFFRILSFSDGFVFNPADSSSEKSSSISLCFEKHKVPLTLKALASDSKNPWEFTNKLQAEENFNLKFNSFAIKLDTFATANQRSSAKEDSIADLEGKNYFSAYRSSTIDSFNFGRKDSSLRYVECKTTLSSDIDFLNLRPAISFKAQEKYSKTDLAKYTDTITFATELPFTVEKQRFNLKYTRSENGLSPTSQGGNYGQDISQLKDSLQERSFFFRTAPIYDLFSQDLSEDIHKNLSANNLETLTYSGLYSFTWKRQIFANLKDLFIPSSFDFSTQRQIVSATSNSDQYILKASLLNTPFNLFGSQSATKLFSWYNTDEYIISLTGTAKIPRDEPESTLWQAAFYTQASYYLKDMDVLKTGLQFTLETDYQWNSKATILYKRNASSSPVVSAAKLIYPKADYSAVKLSRTDSFDVELSSVEDSSTVNQNYKYSHVLLAEITSLFSVNTGLDYDLKIKKDLTSFILSGTIGAKLSF